MNLERDERGRFKKSAQKRLPKSGGGSSGAAGCGATLLILFFAFLAFGMLGAKEEPNAPLGAQSPPDPYKSAPSAQDSPARKPIPFEPGAARLPDSAPNRVMGDAEFCWKLCAAAGLAYMEQHGASAAEGESIAQECLRTNC